MIYECRTLVKDKNSFALSLCKYFIEHPICFSTSFSMEGVPKMDGLDSLVVDENNEVLAKISKE